MMKPVPLDEGGATTGACRRRTATCWTAWNWCQQTVCIPLLLAIVIVLAVQLHTLSKQVRHMEQDQIADLLKQIQNQQAGQETLQVQVEQNHSMTLYQMAGTFTLLASLLTMFHMSTHLRHYHEPAVQRKVIAILWMSVVYSITSFLSLLFPGADGYLAVMKDFYESYTVYNFLSFLIACLGKGDRQTAVQALARHAQHLAPPTRWLRRFYHPPPETSHLAAANAVLTECQILCLQFVLVRPLTSIASFINESMHEQHDSAADDAEEYNPWSYFWSPGFFIAMVTNVSVFLAFRGLLRFYHAVHDDLAWMQPFNKFMSIKGIVFLTFWQGLLISIIVHLRHEEENGGGGDGADVSAAAGAMAGNATAAGLGAAAAASSTTTTTTNHMSPHEEAAQIQNILICLEMLFFSIAHWCVFPAEEWEEGYRPPEQYAKPGIGLSDLVSDMSYIVSSSRQRRRHKQQQQQLRRKQKQDKNSEIEYDDDDEYDVNSLSEGGGDSVSDLEFQTTTTTSYQQGEEHLQRGDANDNGYSDDPPPPPPAPPAADEVPSSSSSSSLSRRSPRFVPDKTIV